MRSLLAALPREAPGAIPFTSSTLTGGRYPVELSVLIDNRRPAGLKYTVDLLSCDSLPRLLAAIRGTTDAPELHGWLRTLWEASGGRLAGVYLSTTFAPGASARVKVHVIGEDDAFDRAVLERLVPGAARRESLDAFLDAMTVLGARFARVIGLAVAGERVVGCKCYVETPYMDLRTITRLAATLGLSVGHAISLLRWYRRFIGPHWGQIGSFGVGLDVGRDARAAALEAYAYPSEAHKPALWKRIDRYAGPASATLRSLASGDASLQLAGSGVETTSFGRLGRMTFYFNRRSAGSLTRD